MPYADPEKKRQYMASYNKKWYQANKEPKDLVSKAVDRKKELRSKKRRWLVDNLGGKCVVTGSDNGLNLEVYLKTPSDRQSWGPAGGKTHPKSVYDYSWSELQTNLPKFVVCDRDHITSYYSSQQSQS
jgi:hypothetical protein|tara:strand:- start:890 stop:1273 length:384 start_codon:yes stop_codon:yes gene_type:complete